MFWLRKNKLYSKLLNLLFAGFIFTIPSNLFKTFFENTAYIHSLKVDYLIPKLHLSDIFIVLLFSFLVVKKANWIDLKKIILQIKNKALWTVLVVILVYTQLTTQHPIVSLQTILRVFLLTIIATILIKNKKIISKQYFSIALHITLIFQSLLSIYQYIFQKSVANYYFLGETNLNSYAGLAKTTLTGSEKILPYGTTAHPNVLAGILSIFTLILFNQLVKQKKRSLITILIIVISNIALLLTQSMSAIFGFIFGILAILYLDTHKLKISVKKMVSIYLISTLVVITAFSFVVSNNITKNLSIYRREYLNIAAIQMIMANPLPGVGFQNFTAHVEEFSPTKEVVRFVQPVHNTLLLFFAQTGVIGVIVLFLLLENKIKNKTSMKHPEYVIALLPIVVLDHYLITLQSGILLLFITYLASKELV